MEQRPDPTPSGALVSRNPLALASDVRFQLFGALFGLGTVHHELQFILEQVRIGPFGEYMERWSSLRPTVGWPSEAAVGIHLLDLLLGALLVVLPWRRLLLLPLAVTFALVTLTSPGRIPSHNSLIHAALAVVLIFGLAEIVERSVRRSGASGPTTDWYRWTVVGLIWLCGLTYLFATLHKLNWTFLSFAESPATSFVGQLTEAVGIPRDSGLAIVGAPVIYGTLLIEASLPVLLLARRTRLFAVLLGLSFHFLMMIKGIFDFPTAIVAFYPLFMTVGEAHTLLAAIRSRPSVIRVLVTLVLGVVGVLAFNVSEYVLDLYETALVPLAVVEWAHALAGYATLFLIAYAIATVGGVLLGRRPSAAPMPAPAI